VNPRDKLEIDGGSLLVKGDTPITFGAGAPIGLKLGYRSISGKGYEGYVWPYDYVANVAKNLGLHANTTIFYNDNTYGLIERMRINSGGNVGIGTASPANLLNVDGDLNVSETGKSDLLFADTSANNVTIGEDGAPYEDLLVYGTVYSKATGSLSPMVIRSVDNEPIPICMKNSARNWVGCMPDEKNNWVCKPNRECDEKVLEVETTEELVDKGASNEEIDRKVTNLKQKFRQGKSLKAIKDEIKAEIGEMQVLDELSDDEMARSGFDIQDQGVSSGVNEVTALRGEIEVLREELSALKAMLNQTQTETATEPAGQPVEEMQEQPVQEPTEELAEEPDISITGASVWKFFSSLLQT
jgi:hypothetical protein